MKTRTFIFGMLFFLIGAISFASNLASHHYWFTIPAIVCAWIGLSKINKTIL